MKRYYNYIYLDPFKPGKFEYRYLNFCLLYEPFYVGKGTKDRYLHHISECIQNDNFSIYLKSDSLKCKRIFLIISKLLKKYNLVEAIQLLGSFIQVFAFTDNEKIAYQNEKIMINRIGMIKNKGTLTNQKDSGIRMDIQKRQTKKLQKLW